MYLVVNWDRKWTVFDFLKNWKISQYVLQKSIIMKNFKIFCIVSTDISGPSWSFWTHDFWSRVAWKWVNFVIVCLKKWFFKIFCLKMCIKVYVRLPVKVSYSPQLASLPLMWNWVRLNNANWRNNKVTQKKLCEKKYTIYLKG
jgi:hypothetical protein